MNLLSSLAITLAFVAASAADETAVALIDGQPLTERDLQASLVLRGVRTPVSPEFRERAVSELIDRELVRRFLARTKVEADPAQLEVALRTAKERLSAGGGTADEVFSSLGIDEPRVRAEIGVPLAWRKFTGQTLTERQIREYFERHRRRLDGTRLRVAQILLKYGEGESPGAAPRVVTRLSAIREEVVSGKTSFEEAARKHSQSPSAEGGGEIGWVRPEWDLPRAVSLAAFASDEGSVSEVVLSPFGAHLVKVLEVEPGDGSLEDARPAVLEELSRELRAERVAAERKAAKIVMTPAGRPKR